MEVNDGSIIDSHKRRPKPGATVSEAPKNPSLAEDGVSELVEDLDIEIFGPGKIPVTIRKPFSNVNANGENDYDDEDGMMVVSSRQSRLMRNNNKVGNFIYVVCAGNFYCLLTEK
jgi:hypothetical protein